MATDAEADQNTHWCGAKWKRGIDIEGARPMHIQPKREVPEAFKNKSEAVAKRHMKNKGTDCPDQSVAGVAKATKAPESAQRLGKGKPEIKTNVGCNLRELGHRSCYDAPTSITNQTEMPSAFVELAGRPVYGRIQSCAARQPGGCRATSIRRRE